VSEQGVVTVITVQEARRILDKAKQIDDVMTNFDHTINQDTADELVRRGADVWAGYPAVNCYSRVWHQDGMFHCIVSRFHVPQEVVSRPKLRDIMDYVCEEYGSA
jgi:hypothetical protein